MRADRNVPAKGANNRRRTNILVQCPGDNKYIDFDGHLKHIK